MDYATGPSLLWAHQLKRENHHLLKRIEALEQHLTASQSSCPPATVVPWESALADLKGRLTALEQSSIAAANSTAEEARKQHGENANFATQLAAVHREVQDLQADVERRLERAAEEVERGVQLLTQLSKKVASLDTEVSTDAANLKQIHDITKELRESAAVLKDRLWAAENSVANLESQVREDGVRLQGTVQRFGAVEADVGATSEKLERVFRVAEVLIDRDEEVRGRVGALETLTANSNANPDAAARQQVAHETATALDHQDPSFQHQQPQILTRPARQNETQLTTPSPITQLEAASQPRATAPPPQSAHHDSLEQARSTPAPHTPKRSKKRQRPLTPIPIPTNRTRSQTKAAAVSKPNENTQTQETGQSGPDTDLDGRNEQRHVLIAQGSQSSAYARPRERPKRRERQHERNGKRARRR